MLDGFPSFQFIDTFPPLESTIQSYLQKREVITVECSNTSLLCNELEPGGAILSNWVTPMKNSSVTMT